MTDTPDEDADTRPAPVDEMLGRAGGAGPTEVVPEHPADSPTDAADAGADVAADSADLAEAGADSADDGADVANDGAGLAEDGGDSAEGGGGQVDGADDGSGAGGSADESDGQGGGPGDDGGATVGRFPDLSGDAEFLAALEAVLLVVDAPVEEDALASALEQDLKRVRAGLRTLADGYTERGSGIDLRRAGEGWRFYTRDRYAPVVEKLLLDGQRAKLTRAALETLAVIAYRQPVTRSRVAAVRGVNVDGVIRTLVVRGLIEESGTDADTGGILYRTTELFLERLGLSSLEDLPPIAPLLPEVDAIDDVD